ncbi:MAG: hypothetical protein CMP58_03610 [Flavobacteriales bacterium]|nr:hypothetical protein [Flavobacteriales bacterium]
MGERFGAEIWFERLWIGCASFNGSHCEVRPLHTARLSPPAAHCQTRRRHPAHQALAGRARREAIRRREPRQLGGADRDPPRLVVLALDVLLLGHRADVCDVQHRAALERVVEP